LVLDVGANGGQFGEELRACGYSGSIISFEPANVAFRELTGRTARDSNWTAHNLALGDIPGRATLNISKFSTFSSLLPQTMNANAFEENSAVSHTEEITVVRLDDICRLQDSDRPFMKIDTQGFEQKVLWGAPNTLKRLFGVLLEIPIARMYEGVWSFEEAIRFMRSVGFVPAQIRPVNFLWRQDPVSVSEFDCLFRRISGQLDIPGLRSPQGCLQV
jgi:FkbM family methyltransferase